MLQKVLSSMSSHLGEALFRLASSIRRGEKIRIRFAGVPQNKVKSHVVPFFGGPLTHCGTGAIISSCRTVGSKVIVNHQWLGKPAEVALKLPSLSRYDVILSLPVSF